MSYNNMIKGIFQEEKLNKAVRLFFYSLTAFILRRVNEMNKNEKQIVCEVIDVLRAIPDIRNNCDMAGLSQLRIEMKKSLSTASAILSDLIWLSEEPDLKEDIEKKIADFKEFIEERKLIWNKLQE
jgi:flagellar biosynthesis regulator FlaF